MKLALNESGMSLIELLIGSSLLAILVLGTNKFVIQQSRMSFAFVKAKQVEEERSRLLKLIDNRKIEQATVNRNIELLNHVSRTSLKVPGTQHPLTIYSSTGKILLQPESCLNIDAQEASCSSENAYLKFKSYWIALANGSYQLKIDAAELTTNRAKIKNLALVKSFQSKLAFSNAVSQREMPMECVTASSPGPVTGPCRTNFNSNSPIQCLSEGSVPGFPNRTVFRESEKVRSYVSCPTTHPYLVQLEPDRGCGYADSRTKILSPSKGECSMVIGAANFHCVGRDTSLKDCKATCCKSPAET